MLGFLLEPTTHKAPCSDSGDTWWRDQSGFQRLPSPEDLNSTYQSLASSLKIIFQQLQSICSHHFHQMHTGERKMNWSEYCGGWAACISHVLLTKWTSVSKIQCVSYKSEQSLRGSNAGSSCVSPAVTRSLIQSRFSPWIHLALQTHKATPTSARINE